MPSLLRRVIHSLQIARATTAATDGGSIRTLQLTFMTLGNVISGISQMQHYGFASRPHAMSDHAIIALSNDPSQSISIASNDQRYQISLQEGEVAIHDDQNQSIHLLRGGITLSDKNGNSIVMNSSGITLTPCTGIVYVAGELQGTETAALGAKFTGNIETTADVIANVGASQVSLLNHQHQNGGGTGLSGAPQPGT
jgi:phage gp45-like